MLQWLNCLIGNHNYVPIHPAGKEYLIYVRISCKYINDSNITMQEKLTQSQLALKIYEESNAKSSS